MRAPDRPHRRGSWLAAGAAGLCALILTGCFQVTPEIVRIGLVAPFEGRYREIGYDVIPAARLAIREYATSHPDGQIAVELVAYDDGGDPEKAAEQAAKLLIDPAVRVVIGHWLDATTLAALPVYSAAGLPLITFSTTDVPGALNLAPDRDALQAAADAWASNHGATAWLVSDTLAGVEAAARQQTDVAPPGMMAVGGPEWGLGQFYALAGPLAEGRPFVTGAALPGDSRETFITDRWLVAFQAGYEAGSLGIPPGPLAVAAYQATWLAIHMAVEATGKTPAPPPIPLPAFDENGRRSTAPVYVYCWQEGILLLNCPPAD